MLPKAPRRRQMRISVVTNGNDNFTRMSRYRLAFIRVRATMDASLRGTINPLTADLKHLRRSHHALRLIPEPDALRGRAAGCLALRGRALRRSASARRARARAVSLP